MWFLGGISWFLAGCGGFWVAYYFSSYGCQLYIYTYIFFCLTCLLFLVNLVPALTEHFYGSIITLFLNVSYFVVTFCQSYDLSWWWVSVISQVTGFHSTDLGVFRSSWLCSNFVLVFLYRDVKVSAGVILLHYLHMDQQE